MVYTQRYFHYSFMSPSHGLSHTGRRLDAVHCAYSLSLLQMHATTHEKYYSKNTAFLALKQLPYFTGTGIVQFYLR